MSPASSKPGVNGSESKHQRATWGEQAQDAFPLTHCGFLKGPASKAPRKEPLGRLAGRRNRVLGFIRADSWTFCPRNNLEPSLRADSCCARLRPPTPPPDPVPPPPHQRPLGQDALRAQSRILHLKKVFLILKPLKFKLGSLS